MKSYKDFCTEYKIETVTFRTIEIDTDADSKSKNVIAINLHFAEDQAPNRIVIKAIAECCSFSWFHFLDDSGKNYENFKQNVCGKYLKDIRIGDYIPLPPSSIQERDINNLIKLEFTDGSEYTFVLRNSSNGYYQGWIEIKITDSIFPPNIK